MKNTRKQISTKKDQLFLDSITQTITGWNINYNRSLLTDLQIEQLYINQNTSNKQKFINILKNGQKIQKYSVLQNMNKYWSTKNQLRSFQILLFEIQKLCLSQPQYLTVIGQGLAMFFKRQKTSNFEFCNQFLRLDAVKLMCNILQIVYTNSRLKQLGDWNIILQSVIDFNFKSNSLILKTDQNMKIKTQIGKFIQSLKFFINSSFSMTALPQKRRTGFHLINGLYNSLDQIRQIALHNVLFFNDDTNSDTRLIIAQILIKILQNKYSPQTKLNKFSQSQIKDIFKIIKIYFFDINQDIAQKSFSAFILMEKIGLLSNQQKSQFLRLFFEQLVELKTYQNKIFSFINILKQILVEKGLCQIIKNQRFMKASIFCFINKHLKIIVNSTQTIDNKNELLLQKLFSIYRQQVFHQGGLKQIQFISQIELQKFNINKFPVFLSYCSLYKQAQNIQFKESIKKEILKTFKNNKIWKFNFIKDNQNIKHFLQVLDQENEQQQSVQIQMCQKLFQNSKWNLLTLLLQEVKKRTFISNNVQKLNLQILKIVLSCPFYMLKNCFQVIIYLIFLNNMNPQFLNIIKEKLVKSKNWIHRRNYLLLYCYIKQNTSFQIHKLITLYPYKSILDEKHLGFKHIFIENIQKAYQFIDPANKIQRATIHQCINQLINQPIAQEQLKQKYLNCKHKLYCIDSNVQGVLTCYERNKILLKKQNQLIKQVTIKKQTHLTYKKTIQTQKSIKSQQNQSKNILTNLKKSFNLKNNSKQILKYSNLVKQIQIQKSSEYILLRQNQFPNKKNSTINLGKINLNHLGKQNLQKQSLQQIGVVQPKLKNQNVNKHLRQHKSSLINIRKKENNFKL